VAIDQGTPPDRLAWFLGADLLGAAALFVEPEWTERDRAGIFADARPDLVVSGAPPVEDHPVPSPAGDGRTHFYLPTTSGSSGRSRVLVRSRDSWLDSFRAFDCGLRPEDVVLIPGPLSSSLFLFGALHALHSGQELRMLPRWSVRDAVRECEAATVVHLVPAMLSALLSVWERERRRSTLHKIICAGARVDNELRERLRRALPGCELIEYYGSAEQSLVAIRRDTALRPVPSVAVEIRDDHGSPQPAGHPGQLWVRSPLLFDGYLDGGRIDFPDEWTAGWSTVDDRATVHADGTLTLHGRAGSTIISGAKNIAAEEVEAALHTAHGVTDVLVVPTPHERLGALVTAVVEADPAAPPTLRELRAHARETLEPAKRPRRWIITSRLPRTASGKPARALVTERLRDGGSDLD
jgi:long-chain acyl-CoA synthetase